MGIVPKGPGGSGFGKAGPAYRPYRPSLVRSWRAAVRSPQQKFKINVPSLLNNVKMQKEFGLLPKNTGESRLIN